MKNKKIIALIVILVIAIICVIAFFGIKRIKKSQYTKADEYEVGGVKFASVNKIVGEKKVTKYVHEKSNIDKLELTFQDSDKENTVETYINYIKDNGNYIDMRTEEQNKRQIASTTDKGLITVQTEITSDGFILTIEVGEGNIKIDPIE